MNYEHKNIKVLYFGSYKPTYPRNKIIIDGLRTNGVTVIECNDRSSSLFVRFFKLFIKYFKIRENFDLMIVGFPGQEVMFLAKLICRKPIVFDVFTSHYMGYILDRKYFSEKSLRASYYKFLDRWSCKMADIVFLDTQAHIEYFVRQFDLDPGKFRRIWLGANPELHKIRDSHKNEHFSVLFWGGFIPLQGVDVIIKAARILKNEDIEFNLAGKGQTLEECKKMADEWGLNKVHFLGKVSDEILVEKIAESDVCLGAFSNGEKADITIQNKIFEAMASRKPMVTMRTTALKELLDDQLMLCDKNNPEDLADKILKLKNNSELRRKIAEDGYKLFLDKLTPEKIGKDLIKVLEEIL